VLGYNDLGCNPKMLEPTRDQRLLSDANVQAFFCLPLLLVGEGMAETGKAEGEWESLSNRWQSRRGPTGRKASSPLIRVKKCIN